MAQFKLGIIGCGKPRSEQGATGFGMSHAHMKGYKQSPDVEFIAMADISEENARAFQQTHGGERIYTDYHEMLKNEKLDIVSICTWPKLHAPMVVAAAEAGVKAIHCEKPMAPTFGECKRMVQVCQERGVQLTFNHQRRFNTPFRKAKAMLKEGRIGKLIRLEGTCSNMCDWGTHWLDMFFYYNDETPAEWVLGQIDARDPKEIFALVHENQAVCHFKFQNDVHGLLVTGYQAGWEAMNRLIGTEGVIEVTPTSGGNLRVWSKGDSFWETIETDENIHDSAAVARGVLDLIDALKSGREPELAGRRALQATEVIFATYESSRRRGRVDLPLQIEDSPLLDILGRKA